MVSNRSNEFSASCVGLLAFALIPLAWLVPNHYPPWTSAWSDGWALVCLALGAALAWDAKRDIQWQRAWLLALCVALTSIALQAAFGTIYYTGDAWIAALYVLAFGVALLAGSTLPRARASESLSGLDLFGSFLVMAAIASVGIALVQWTAAMSLGIYAADLPPGSRPFANVGQPNNFCTLAFMGLCVLATLHEGRRIGRSCFWFGAAFFILGMILSGSRTGWLQMGLLIAVLVWRGRHIESRLNVRHALGLLALFALGSLLWPAINDLLLLGGDRSLQEQMHAGVRLPLWRAMLDAVMARPFWGYGWQQMVLAQEAVSLDHPPLLHHFEHAHNIVLDLLLWAGIPLGGAIVGLAVWALWNQARSLCDARAIWLYTGALGVIAHGMVEFPLEYAYFLIPTGLLLGAAQGLSPIHPQGFSSQSGRESGLRWTLPVAGFALLAAVLVTGLDYVRAEQSTRLLRFEVARLGYTRIESTLPDFLVLNQLIALQRLIRTEAREGMKPAELERMQQAAARFAYPSAMFRYALAAGLNGKPEAARLNLKRLCSMHPTARCNEARVGWKAMQSRYPALREIPAP